MQSCKLVSVFIAISAIFIFGGISPRNKVEVPAEEHTEFAKKAILPQSGSVLVDTLEQKIHLQLEIEGKTEDYSIPLNSVAGQWIVRVKTSYPKHTLELSFSGNPNSPIFQPKYAYMIK